MTEKTQQDKIAEAAEKWHRAKKAAQDAVDSERAARAELVALAFPQGLIEGTNTFNLTGKWNIKATGVVTRKVDPAALPSVLQKIVEKFDGLDVSDCIKYTPEIKTKEYKALDPRVRKMLDNALTIKGTSDNTPQVEIKESKR